MTVSLSRNQEPVSQDNPQTFVVQYVVSRRSNFPSYERYPYHRIEGSMHVLKDKTLGGEVL